MFTGHVYEYKNGIVFTDMFMSTLLMSIIELPSTRAVNTSSACMDSDFVERLF